MTEKEIYIMGRAEYLSEKHGMSLTSACKIASEEWDEKNTPKNTSKEDGQNEK